jgi:hypothetical protein
MPKSCIVCNAVASPDVLIQFCDVCHSALYCSRTCQRKDWKKQHKQICKLLNTGHGGMQVRTDHHTRRSIVNREEFEGGERKLGESEGQRFFKLFQESAFEGSRAAALEMKKIAKRQPKHNQKFLLFHGIHLLIRCSNSEMLSWPNSPLLVMLQFIDPNVLISGVVEGSSFTLLHSLADMLDPFDYSTHENQLILAKQLIEHGANVNAVMIPQGKTPLDYACFAGVVTNLNFVEFLLEEGADPNAQDYLGMTPLMCTLRLAPGAAKFLLNWPTTDVNITDRSGESFLVKVRSTITDYSNAIARPDNPEMIQHQFQLRQWREIEVMLVERGAQDIGITVIE